MYKTSSKYIHIHVQTQIQIHTQRYIHRYTDGHNTQTDRYTEIYTQQCIQTHTSSEGVPVALHITAGAGSPENNSVSFKLFVIVTRGGPVGAAHQHYNNY